MTKKKSSLIEIAVSNVLEIAVWSELLLEKGMINKED
jgi:hypothetical protein